MLNNLIKKTYAKLYYPKNENYVNQITYAINHGIKFKKLPEFINYTLTNQNKDFQDNIKFLVLLTNHGYKYAGFENNIVDILKIEPDVSLSSVINKKNFNVEKVSEDNKNDLFQIISCLINSDFYDKYKEKIFYNCIRLFNENSIVNADLPKKFKKTFFQKKTNLNNFFEAENSPYYYIDKNYIDSHMYRKAIIDSIDGVFDEVGFLSEEKKKHFYKIDISSDFYFNRNDIFSDSIDNYFIYKKNIELDFFIEKFTYLIEKYKLFEYFDSLYLERNVEQEVYNSYDVEKKSNEQYYQLKFNVKKDLHNCTEKCINKIFYNFFNELVDGKFIEVGLFFLSNNEKGFGFSTTTINHILSNKSTIDFKKTSDNYYKNLKKLLNPNYVSLKQKAFLNNSIDFQSKQKKNRKIL